MNYTVINTPPTLIEQARQLLIQYSGGQLDCNFQYQQLPPIVSTALFPTEEAQLFLKNFPVSTPFCFLTYSSLADLGYTNMVTMGLAGSNVILTACKGVPTAENIVFEISHALAKYLQGRNIAIDDTDINTPTPDFVKAKLDSLLPFLVKLIG